LKIEAPLIETLEIFPGTGRTGWSNLVALVQSCMRTLKSLRFGAAFDEARELLVNELLYNLPLCTHLTLTLMRSFSDTDQIDTSSIDTIWTPLCTATGTIVPSLQDLTINMNVWAVKSHEYAGYRIDQHLIDFIEARERAGFPPIVLRLGYDSSKLIESETIKGSKTKSSNFI
jgi:hypothetical protein